MEYIRIIFIAGLAVPFARGVAELGGSEGLAMLVSGVLTALVARTSFFSFGKRVLAPSAPIEAPPKRD